MKVEELIDILKHLDGDSIVIISKDSEGNAYSPLSGMFTAAYDRETSEITTKEDYDTLKEFIQMKQDKEKALVLSPEI